MPARKLHALAWSVAAFAALSAATALALDGGVNDLPAGPIAVSVDAGAQATEPEVLAAADAGPGFAEEDFVEAPSRTQAPPIAHVKSLARGDDLLAQAYRDPSTGRLMVKAKDAARTLTVDPQLQQKLTSILESYETPYAAVVALEPSSGRVLAMAEHSQLDPSLRGLTTKAVFPAASVFKIVTATALLDKGLTPESEECFHGGKRKITEKHLEDSAKDSVCMSLADALAFSANGVFAKLTYKNLSADSLRHWATAYHFNRALDFPVPTETSLASFPEDPLGLAQTGAGFGDVFMSPLHGAAIAAVAANGGVWKDPVLFEDQADKASVRVLSPERAKTLADMLERTVAEGTARRIFHERGFKVTSAVGKTGSLADKKPFRDYTWFVGYAPKDDPKVAVAAVIVNDMKWRIRATWLAREAMRLYLEEKKPLAAAE